MKHYRFVGSAPCRIGDTEYERFGSRAQFTADLAKQVLDGGGCFIPEADFQSIGFTEAEVAKYAYAGGFPEPTADFIAKRKQAQARAVRLMGDLTQVDAYHADTQEGAE